MEFVPRGIYTAIITPSTPAGDFDEPTFRKLIEFQIESGIAGLLVVGGSGEYVNLSMAERFRVVDVAVDQVAGRVPIIVGALSPSTREVLEVARHAAHAKAGAVLVLPPYYIKPSAEGIFEHFAKVAETAPIKIVAYNNAGRTGLTLDVAMLKRLATISSIVALKECERDLATISTKIAAVGERIAIMSGDDDLGFPTFVLGSPGGIFMSSNLIPAFHVKLFAAVQEGRIEAARKAHYALMPLIEALYTANHPGPLKEAMSYIGRPVGAGRVPLQSGNPENLKRADQALRAIGEFSFK